MLEAKRVEQIDHHKHTYCSGIDGLIVMVHLYLDSLPSFSVYSWANLEPSRCFCVD